MGIPVGQSSTGTYTFAPAASDLVLYAYSLIGMRRVDLTTQHYIDASMAANLAMVNLSNHMPMRFGLETQTLSLVQGTATYNLATRTIAVPLVTIATTDGSGSTTERVIGPISAYEYRALPTKAQQGPPTSYWFNLASTPTITLWPTPDGTTTYTANVQSFRQLQDVDLTNLKGVDSPYRFLDALATEIAARLADSYQPAKSLPMYGLAEKRLNLALGRDQESVPMTIAPGLSNYYRVY